MKLYEISNALKNCIKVDENTIIDGETGEIIDTAAIDALQMDFETKGIHIARWIKELRAEADALKTEKQRLDKRKKACENKADSLEKYLDMCLGGKPLKDATVNVTYRKSESVEVNLEELMKWDDCDRYLKYSDPEPMKAEIKKAIKGGSEIPGATIVQKNNISIG